MKLVEAIDAFLDETNVGPQTKSNYQASLAAFEKWADQGRSLSVEDITRPMVSHYQEYLEGKGQQPSTVHQRLVVLKRFINWLVDEGYLEASPMAKFRLPRDPLKPKEPLKGEDVEKVLNACTNDRDRAIIALMLDAGLRKSEVIGLTIEDVDLDQKRVTVFGKGRKTRILGIPTAARYIRKYLRTREKGKGTDHLFYTYGTHEPISIHTMNAMFRRLADLTGIPHLHPHRLRHTMATTIYRDSGDIRLVKDLLGHSSLQTTERYVHTDVDHMVEQHERYSPLKKLLKK